VNRVAVLLFLVCAFGTAQTQVFQANHHALFLDCQGQPSRATVVLLAGGGGTTDTWDKVQPEISQFTRVCSYDRLGLGKSGPIDKDAPQTASEIVADLESLLVAARVDPPYILVGHSIGGLYARSFDERYDSQISGIVLVDSSHEEQIWRFAEGEPEALSEYPRWKDQAFMSGQGFLPFGKLLLWHFSKPLVVIEHGTPPELVWHKMQKDLAARSPQGQFITATRSSHSIQKIQPELVIDAVYSVVDKSAEGIVPVAPARLH
jgi:hypothetical protein